MYREGIFSGDLHGICFGKYSSYQIFHKLCALKTEGMGGTIQESIGEIDDKVRSEQWHSVVAREKKG